jgi:hypothetical protein
LCKKEAENQPLALKTFQCFDKTWTRRLPASLSPIPIVRKIDPILAHELTHPQGPRDPTGCTTRRVPPGSRSAHRTMKNESAQNRKLSSESWYHMLLKSWTGCVDLPQTIDRDLPGQPCAISSLLHDRD